jgi:ABC-type uncharacterized transport system substrate-binding protein
MSSADFHPFLTFPSARRHSLGEDATMHTLWHKTLPMFLLCLACTTNALAATCLYVSSYHRGYAWNDGIERGMESVLNGTCDLQKFYMDTNRNTDAAFAQQKALEAKALIETATPNVVIACDDSASQYLIMPYFKDAAVPFVFCGVNWTVEPYGYPYTNVTGMVEVSPITPLLKEIQRTVKGATHGVFLAADVPTQHKEFGHFQKTYRDHGVTLVGVFVKTLMEWETAYAEAQTADFVVLSNTVGITDWDKARAGQYALAQAHKLTVTTYEWMLPYTMLAMTKVPEEQGEWAAKVAVQILAGTSPQQIPIVANSRWNLYVNPRLLDQAGLHLAPQILHKATKVER